MGYLCDVCEDQFTGRGTPVSRCEDGSGVMTVCGSCLDGLREDYPGKDPEPEILPRRCQACDEKPELVTIGLETSWQACVDSPLEVEVQACPSCGLVSVDPKDIR